MFFRHWWVMSSDVTAPVFSKGCSSRLVDPWHRANSLTMVSLRGKPAEVKPSDQLKAWELLGRHLGLFKDVQVHQGTIIVETGVPQPDCPWDAPDEQASNGGNGTAEDD